jgi:hypothetical protein
MATYTLISSNVLSSSAASVTFSAIPATYTDLVLKLSVRAAGTDATMKIGFNGSTSNFSLTLLAGNGSSAYSDNYAGYGYNMSGYRSKSTDTSNTFGNGEIYIPSYTISQNKPISSIGVSENNATSAFIGAVANLWSNISAITSIEIGSGSGDMAAGSSFYLYGISNA